MPKPTINVLYFGMNGVFSINILQHLLTQNNNIVGIVMPACKKSGKNSQRYTLPVYGSAESRLHMIAQNNRIPSLELAEASIADGTLETFITRTRPDVIIVACFPYILPDTITRTIPHGCYNLHPSKLPEYRGPTPIFWQFYYGEQNMGITVHEISSQLDAGDIIIQDTSYIKDGTSGIEANKQLSEPGADLLSKTLKNISNNSIHKSVQNEEHSSYYGYPSHDDFIISTDWSAQRAYNFIHGTSQWMQKYVIQTGVEQITTSTASSYSATEALDNTLDKKSNELLIQFNPGILRIPV